MMIYSIQIMSYESSSTHYFNTWSIGEGETNLIYFGYKTDFYNYESNTPNDSNYIKSFISFLSLEITDSSKSCQT